MSKTIRAAWTIEPLTRAHNRRDFECGEAELNEFIQKHARQQQDKQINRTFVAVERDSPTKKVLGFYTLSAGSISFQSLPGDLQRGLPSYPIPVARLGRLARDHSMARKGLGPALLRHALLRIANIAQNEIGIGIVAVVVDAKSDNAVRFYERYGFVSFEDNPMSLFLPIKTILKGLV